ncbi:MAG: aldo/keto reductase [Paludibacteraceae bacterium]
MKKTLRNVAILSVFFAATSLSYAQSNVENAVFIPTKTLNNGVKMPCLGFGTLELTDSVGINSVARAIRLGYRLFDTAAVYGNEEAVGKGIKQSGIDRKKLFISTKLWVSDMGYESTKKAFERSLKKLGVDYVDMYLIHRPHGDVPGSWKAMEELYKEGRIRAIGVSNFDSVQLAGLIAKAEIKPAINQIEINPYFQQPEMQKMIEEFGVQVEGWSPFAQGRNGLFTNKVLVQIGKKYNKTAAQVTLRWLIQRGIVVIPRTSNPVHMKENLNVFDFELSKADMQKISALDKKTSQFPEWK